MEMEVELSVGTCKVRGLNAKDDRLTAVHGQMIKQAYDVKKKKQPHRLDELEDEMREEIANVSLKMEANCVLEHSFELPPGTPLWKFIGELNTGDNELFKKALDTASGMSRDTAKKSGRHSSVKQRKSKMKSPKASKK